MHIYKSNGISDRVFSIVVIPLPAPLSSAQLQLLLLG